MFGARCGILVTVDVVKWTSPGFLYYLAELLKVDEVLEKIKGHYCACELK